VNATSPSGNDASVSLTEGGGIETSGLSDELDETIRSISDYKSVERATATIPQAGKLTDGERYMPSSIEEKAQRIVELFNAVGWDATVASKE
jgi:hypothetical protein